MDRKVSRSLGRKSASENRAAEPVSAGPSHRGAIPARRPKSELPSGLPANWPDSSPEELGERPVRHIEVGRPQIYAFKDNFIKTSRFTTADFLPKFFLEFFDPKSKIANVYFIFIAIFQCIPGISITRGVPTTLIPLMVLMIIDGTLLFLEDRQPLEVGDFVQIHSRGTVPADLIVISVAERSAVATGKCFVETKSLDGETSLKSRNAISATFRNVNTVKSLESVKGTVSMEHPNKSTASFQGIIDLETATCEVTKDNVLLAGSVLRNTDWIIGLIVNTGSDSKIYMSMSEPELKKSKLELSMQREIIKVIGMLIFMCGLGALGHSMWETSRDVGKMWYLQYDPEPSKNFILYFMHYLLVNAPIIPVSLYVSIVFARYVQSYFMRNDLEMFHEASGTTMDVKNMHLNEQLGQVSHIISDKTGTLTCNIMDFRKMSVHGVAYGQGISILEAEEKAQENAVKHVAFYCERYEKDMSILGPQRARIQNFFRVLAICNNAEVEHDPNNPGNTRISTSNPDDEALIHAADYFGYKMVDRVGTSLKIENRYSKQADNLEDVEILHIFEFTSERRRMSVVVKEPSGKIVLYMKGAKSTVYSRLSSETNKKETLEITELDYKSFVQEGLRVLCMASVTIQPDRYEQWQSSYAEARLDLRQIDRQKNNESNLVDDLINDLESNLTLLGCSGIEDRLQYGVSECVDELIAAGINIWMLTGDAQETAVNSSLAAKLILPEQHSVHVMNINNFDFSLEEDGLATMKPCPDGMRYLLSELNTCVLAIGDGANDMSMIRSAHVGVGLVGQEGSAAASNFLMALAMYWFNFSCVSRNTFYRFPQMYRLCVTGIYFTSRTLWSWMIMAVYESTIASVMPIFLLQGLDKNNGNLTTFWEAGGLTMTVIIVCVNMKLFFIQNKFHWSHFLVISFGPISWILSIYVLSVVIEFDFNAHGIFEKTLPNPYFWFALILTLTATTTRDIYSCCVERHFNFQPHHIIQEADAFQSKRIKRNMKKGVVDDINNVDNDEEEEDADKVEDIEGGLVTSAKENDGKDDDNMQKMKISNDIEMAKRFANTSSPGGQVTRLVKHDEVDAEDEDDNDDEDDDDDDEDDD
eukprot:GSChrysophyteH1.ASY1.ANO1.817.1 assembled CDS